jgi:hypothetical protein
MLVLWLAGGQLPINDPYRFGPTYGSGYLSTAPQVNCRELRRTVSSSFRPTLLPRGNCFLYLKNNKIALVLDHERDSLGQYCRILEGSTFFVTTRLLCSRQGPEAPPTCDEAVVVLHVVNGPIDYGRLSVQQANKLPLRRPSRASDN